MMTDDEINRAVATQLGWRRHATTNRWLRRGCRRITIALPDFCTDHTAAWEIRQAIHRNHRQLLINQLDDIMAHESHSMLTDWAFVNSTPRQQAEAFLRMRGKWVEDWK